MSAIGKGDWVQCVATDDGHPIYVVRGDGVYFCEAVITLPGPKTCTLCGEPDGRPGLVLTGVTPAGAAWCPCNFRPLGRGGKRRLVNSYADYRRSDVADAIAYAMAAFHGRLR